MGISTDVQRIYSQLTNLALSSAKPDYVMGLMRTLMGLAPEVDPQELEFYVSERARLTAELAAVNSTVGDLEAAVATLEVLAGGGLMAPTLYQPLDDLRGIAVAQGSRYTTLAGVAHRTGDIVAMQSYAFKPATVATQARQEGAPLDIGSQPEGGIRTSPMLVAPVVTYGGKVLQRYRHWLLTFDHDPGLTWEAVAQAIQLSGYMTQAAEGVTLSNTYCRVGKIVSAEIDVVPLRANVVLVDFGPINTWPTIPSTISTPIGSTTIQQNGYPVLMMSCGSFPAAVELRSVAFPSF